MYGMTIKSPLFSIITVTLNNLGGLKKTHDSLRIQNNADYEWIVIDGGSADGTADYLKTTTAQWISEADRGIYDAMNKGLERACGDYMLFLNAGDALAAPDILAKLKLAAEQTPDFIYGDSYEESGTSTFYKKSRSHSAIMTGMFTHHQAMLYRRAALGDLRYDLNYKIAADYDFTARFLQKTDRILYYPFPFCIFESGGISQQRAGQGRREQFEIRRHLWPQKTLVNSLIYATQSAVWTLRRFMPNLYRALKSSGNSDSGCVRN